MFTYFTKIIIKYYQSNKHQNNYLEKLKSNNCAHSTRQHFNYYNIKCKQSIDITTSYSPHHIQYYTFYYVKYYLQ